MPAKSHSHYCPECDRSWRHPVCQVPWKPELACWKCEDASLLEWAESSYERAYQWTIRDVQEAFSPVLGVSQVQKRSARRYTPRGIW